VPTSAYDRQSSLFDFMCSFFDSKVSSQIKYLEDNGVDVKNVAKVSPPFCNISFDNMIELIKLYSAAYKGTSYEKGVDKFLLFYCVGEKFQKYRKAKKKSVLSKKDIADITGSTEKEDPDREHFLLFVFRFQNNLVWSVEQSNLFKALEEIVIAYLDLGRFYNFAEDIKQIIITNSGIDTKKQEVKLRLAQDYAVEILDGNIKRFFLDRNFHTDESALFAKRLENLKDMILNPNQHLIDGMDLNVRASNSLKGVGIVNVLLLLCYKRREILKLPSMTQKFVVLIESKLFHTYGIKLKI